MNIFSLSNVGRVRTNNEDSCLFDIAGEESAVFVVCDGMGGMQAGQVASYVASTVFIEQMKNYIREKMTLRYMESTLRNAVSFASYDTYKKANSDPQFYGMGTTLVGGIYNEGQALIANIGDSRAYILDDDGLRQLTRDHSLVEELVLRGEITQEQAKRHPRKNIITRALGPERKPKPDIFSVAMKKGQKLLLCSDGLTNMLEPDAIKEILMNEDAEKACVRLIDAANENGGSDNITVLILVA